MNKYSLPEFFKLDTKVDVDSLYKDYEKMFQQATKEGCVHCGRGNVILDLTFVDPSNLRFKKVSFAGSSTERAISHYKAKSSLKSNERRLATGRQRDPMADDRNHNCFKPFVVGTYTEQLLCSLGPVAKATFALLEPNSWWPSHYDFSINHAAKLNIPVRTNDDAVSLVWNQREREMKEWYMREGEVWWLNVAHKHTSFNWGETDRLFLLATYYDPKPFLREVQGGSTKTSL